MGEEEEEGGGGSETERNQEKRAGLLSEGTAGTNRTCTEKNAHLVDGRAAEEASKGGGGDVRAGGAHGRN